MRQPLLLGGGGGGPSSSASCGGHERLDNLGRVELDAKVGLHHNVLGVGAVKLLHLRHEVAPAHAVQHPALETRQRWTSRFGPPGRRGRGRESQRAPGSSREHGVFWMQQLLLLLLLLHMRRGSRQRIADEVLEKRLALGLLHAGVHLLLLLQALLLQAQLLGARRVARHREHPHDVDVGVDRGRAVDLTAQEEDDVARVVTKGSCRFWCFCVSMVAYSWEVSVWRLTHVQEIPKWCAVLFVVEQ